MHFNYPHSQRKKNLSAQSPILKVLSVFSLLNSDDLKHQVLDFTNSYLGKLENLQNAFSDKRLPFVFQMKDFVSWKSTSVSTLLQQDTVARHSEPWPMELSVCLRGKCCCKSAGHVEWAEWTNGLRCSSRRIGTESGSPRGDTQPLPLTSSVTLVGYQVKLYFILFLLIVEIMWLRAALLKLLVLVQEVIWSRRCAVELELPGEADAAGLVTTFGVAKIRGSI